MFLEWSLQLHGVGAWKPDELTLKSDGFKGYLQ